MGRRAKAEVALDVELEDLPPEMRWREWMGRVEAVIFASPVPVTREVLARVVGKACNLDLIIDDIKEELRGRPYELVAVAGGWRHQTRKGFAEAIRAATGLADPVKELSRAEAGALMAIAYFQPVTRGEISEMFGREISRDLIASLCAASLIAAGPRSLQSGAPYAVCRPGFGRRARPARSELEGKVSRLGKPVGASAVNAARPPGADAGSRARSSSALGQGESPTPGAPDPARIRDRCAGR